MIFTEEDSRAIDDAVFTIAVLLRRSAKEVMADESTQIKSFMADMFEVIGDLVKRGQTEVEHWSEIDNDDAVIEGDEDLV